MILIVGLGNPGRKYQKTRHNLGFQVINEFLRKNRDVHNFQNFRFEKKFQAEISEGKFNNEKIILAKPQTFMNLSGIAAKFLLKEFFSKKLINSAMTELVSFNLWVVHDDIDLPLGKIRIAIGRGAAGHKGVQSIIDELKTKIFVRFRIGIQPKMGKPKNPEEFVLQKFNKDEEKIAKEAIKKTVEAIEVAIREGMEKATNTYN